MSVSCKVDDVDKVDFVDEKERKLKMNTNHKAIQVVYRKMFEVAVNAFVAGVVVGAAVGVVVCKVIGSL